MSKVRRPCIDCGRLAEPGQSRCRSHRAAELRRRKKAGLTGKRGTSAAWRSLRLRILERDGYRCVDCGRHIGQLQRVGLHLEVDHEDNDPTNDDETNLACRCAGAKSSCHVKRHAEVRR